MNIVGPLEDIRVDIRSKAGDPKTSLIATPKSPNADGTTSVLIEDEDRVGEAALIVALSGDGTVRETNPGYHRRLIMVELDTLDRLAAKAFDGYIVRKDLALRFRGQYPVPTYVGNSC